MAEGRERCVGVKAFHALPARPPPGKGSAKYISPASHIIGHFQRLKDLRHTGLCAYIDVVNPAHGTSSPGDHLFVISEHFEDTLAARLDRQKESDDAPGLPEPEAKRIAYEILLALAYLHENAVTHRALSVETGRVKLADYGMFAMTERGRHVDFPVGDIQYLPPEAMPELVEKSLPLSGPTADTWMLGIMLFRILTGNFPYDIQSRDTASILRAILTFCGHETSEPEVPLDLRNLVNLNVTRADRDELLRDLNTRHTENLTAIYRANSKSLNRVSAEMKDIMRLALTVDPAERPSASELLTHPYFLPLRSLIPSCSAWVVKPFLRSDLIEIVEKGDNDNGPSRLVYHGALEGEDELQLPELFALWLLAGGELEALLPPSQKLLPPILRIPLIARSVDGRLQAHAPPSSGGAALLYDPSIVAVPSSDLVAHCLKNRTKQVDGKFSEQRMRRLSHRENDFVYQRKRILRFRSLLSAYPETRSLITKSARKDIPPVVRGEVWGAILGVPSNEEMERVYRSVDLEHPHPSDQQILLDVPRCHQYHPLLASPEGHLKLSNVLRAWARLNPNLNYWQGVDSLLAPFLVLNFRNEAKSLCCLQLIVDIYLKPFFAKDKSVYLQEHLLMFQKLLAYVDPQLAIHMLDEGFHADLFAIPWFLTMFAHIFSLDQIMRIWDTVLVSPPSLPLFFAIAILQALREVILPLDFNSLILLFSSLPALSIEGALIKALEYLRSTPPSLTSTTYDLPESNSDNPRWWEQKRTLQQLREELFARISLNDLINVKDSSLILDIRSQDEFAVLHFPGSKRVVDVTAVSAVVKARRAEHVIVIGKGDEAAISFANDLVRAEVPRVALLNGGIEVLVADAKGLLQGYGASH